MKQVMLIVIFIFTLRAGYVRAIEKYNNLDYNGTHMGVTRCMMYCSWMNINKNRTTVFVSRSRLHKDFSMYIDTISKRRNLLIFDMSTSDKERKIRRLFLNRGYTDIPKLGRLSFFIIYAHNLHDLELIMDQLFRLYIFDPRAYFMIVLYIDPAHPEVPLNEGRDKAQDTYIKECFRILWDKYVFNSVVLFCFYYETNCGIFTWFPYATLSECGKKKNSYNQIDLCEYDSKENVLYVNYLNRTRTLYQTDVEKFALREPRKEIVDESIENKMRQKYFVRKFYDQVPTGVFEYRGPNMNNTQKYYFQKNPFKIFRYGHRHFFEKLPANYHGCRIRCALFYWPPFVTAPSTPWLGIEHKMFLDISRFLNFTLEWIPIENDRRENNDLLKLKYFNENKADVAFGNLYPIVEHNHLADYSFGYLYDSVIWIVPRAGLKPTWMNLMHVFTPLVWTIIVIIFILYTLVYTIYSVQQTNRPYDTAIMECIIVIFSSNITFIPANQTMRLILLVWILYSFHINLVYEVQLTTILTKPLREKQITTPDEIVSEKIEFGFAKGFSIHFERVDTPRAKYFLSHNHECNFRTCFNQMQYKKFATLGNKMYVSHAFAFGNVTADVFVLPGAVTKSFIHMYMKKGFPLRDQINFFIRRMIEIGYLAAAQENYWHLVRNVTYNRGKRRVFRESDFLTMKHFAGAFGFLIVGELLAFIAFLFESFPSARKYGKRIIEIFCPRLRDKKQSSNIIVLKT